MPALRGVAQASHKTYRHRTNPEWMRSDGLPCRRDPKAFHPEKRENDLLGRAKELCLECHHLSDCLVYALNNDEDGVWGGTSADERRQMIRNNNARGHHRR